MAERAANRGMTSPVLTIPADFAKGRSNGTQAQVDAVLEALSGAAPPDFHKRAKNFDWELVRPAVLRLMPGVEAALDAWQEGKPYVPPRLFTLISASQAMTLPAPEWGIEGIYPAGGLVLLFGPRGVGKTFVTLGWSFAHAATGDWLGHAAQPGRVVYILAEGRGGLGQRVRAQMEFHGIDKDPPVYFITQAVPTLDAAEVNRLIATIQSLPEPPALIVWDTLSRTFVGGEENSAKDMALYVSHIDRVGEACGNPTRVVIHHSGHASSERERGSSVLGGAADTIVALRERDGMLELACEKQKDASEFSPLALQLQEAGSSRVISLHDGRGVTDGALSHVERLALRSLHDGFLDDGASASAWLAASDMAESSFYKARTSLVRKELVEQAGNGRGARYKLTPHGQLLLKLHNSTVTP